MFLHTWHPSPIIFSLGNFDLHWYGLLLAIGALAGWWLARWLAHWRGIEARFITDMFIWLVPAGLVGGRLYHVINEWPYYQQHANEIFAVWNGGLGIHGAIIAGALTVWIFARRYHLSTAAVLDVLVPGLALGQAIGRWGNYFNQELFGRPTQLPWGIPIDSPNRPFGYESAPYFHPTFLYESIGNVVIAALLVYLFRRTRRPGVITAVYFLSYAVLRIATESLRIDRTPIIDGIRLPIIVSSIMILGSLAWLLTRNASSRART